MSKQYNKIIKGSLIDSLRDEIERNLKASTEYETFWTIRDDRKNTNVIMHMVCKFFNDRYDIHYYRSSNSNLVKVTFESKEDN